MLNFRLLCLRRPTAPGGGGGGARHLRAELVLHPDGHDVLEPVRGRDAVRDRELERAGAGRPARRRVLKGVLRERRERERVAPRRHGACDETEGGGVSD
jgi:hypothetical protein